MIPIGRAFSLWFVRKITFVMATQMGKSATIQNIIGHRLDDDPAPVNYVGPTQSNIDNVVEPKFMEMFKHCQSLWGKLAKGQKSTKHHKRVSGVSLRFAWAGSPTEMASDSAALGFVDEYDRMESDVKGEGDPAKLTEARTSVYPDGKTGITSTPTEGNVETYKDPRTGMTHWRVAEKEVVASKVWRSWQQGSRHEWAVPCPECREYFIPRLCLMWWPEKSTPQRAEREARLTCEHCGAMIESRSKGWMNERGMMIAPGQKPLKYEDGDEGVFIIDLNDDPSAPFERDDSRFVRYGDFKVSDGHGSHLSFWVSGICTFSSKKTFGLLASNFLSAVRSGKSEDIKGVINTDYGELYRVSGEAPKWDVVKARELSYPQHTVPSGAMLLTAGVDVQINRLVYVVRAFGESWTSWLVDRGELWGETDQPDVWDQLDKLLNTQWNGFNISKMAIDSGYRKDDVYTFCRDHRPIAIPTKGHDQQEKPYRASTIDITHRGKVIKGGLQLWHFDSDIMKMWVHSRIEWPEDKPGGWYVFSDIDEDYCKQICAEERIVKPSGAITWVKVTTHNHYLDAEALAYLACRINGLRASIQNQTPQMREAAKELLLGKMNQSRDPYL